MFPYLLLFTALFRSLVSISHHPALFSLSSPLPSLLAGPHTSPKFILLFSSFSPFSVQTSHETPKSILDPMHPRWQRLLSPRKEEGKCFHLHLYYKKRLLSEHVLRSQILLVQWCVYDATFSPMGCWRLPWWDLKCLRWYYGIGAGWWRLTGNNPLRQTLALIAWLDHFLSPFLSLSVSLYHTQTRACALFFPLSVTPFCYKWSLEFGPT